MVARGGSVNVGRIQCHVLVAHVQVEHSDPHLTGLHCGLW